MRPRRAPHACEASAFAPVLGTRQALGRCPRLISTPSLVSDLDTRRCPCGPETAMWPRRSAPASPGRGSHVWKRPATKQHGQVGPRRKSEAGPAGHEAAALPPSAAGSRRWPRVASPSAPAAAPRTRTQQRRSPWGAAGRGEPRARPSWTLRRGRRRPGGAGHVRPGEYRNGRNRARGQRPPSKKQIGATVISKRVKDFHARFAREGAGG